MRRGIWRAAPWVLPWLALAALPPTLSGPVAVAQELPAATDPGRLREQLQPPFRPAPEADEILPQAAPELAPIPPGLDKIRFVLRQVRLDGVTAYDTADLLGLIALPIGREVPLTLVYELARRIGRRYRADGYLLSRAIVPPQEITAGRVTIRVIEGFVDRVAIVGDLGGRESLVRRYAEPIIADRPLRRWVLERYLLLLRDLPGLTLRTIIRPSPEVPGASDLVLVVGHRFAQGLAQFDNRGTRFTGPDEAIGTLTLRSALGFYETVSLQFAAARQTEEFKFARLGAAIPLGREGTEVSLSASYGRNSPGDILTPLEIDGETVGLALAVRQPLWRSRLQNLALNLGFDLLNSKTRSLGTLISEDRIRAVRGDLDYDLQDRLLGVNRVRLGVSHGLEVLGARGTGEANLSRANAEARFTKLNLDFSRLQRLTERWSLFFSLAGQYAFNPLPAAEEFGYGGPVFGRGYDASEIVGDHGLAGAAELQWSVVTGVPSFQSFQLYGFYDIGTVWQRSEPEGSLRQSGASAGGGLRLNLTPAFQINVELAKPLTRPPLTARDDRKKRLRLFLFATFQF